MTARFTATARPEARERDRYPWDNGPSSRLSNPEDPLARPRLRVVHEEAEETVQEYATRLHAERRAAEQRTREEAERATRRAAEEQRQERLSWTPPVLCSWSRSVERYPGLL